MLSHINISKRSQHLLHAGYTPCGRSEGENIAEEVRGLGREATTPIPTWLHSSNNNRGHDHCSSSFNSSSSVPFTFINRSSLFSSYSNSFFCIRLPLQQQQHQLQRPIR